MAKIVGDNRSRMEYLRQSLQQNFNINLTFNETDRDYPAYQQRIKNALISKEGDAQKINNFLAWIDKSYVEMYPSQSELEWCGRDPKASLWLVCELYDSDDKKLGYDIGYLSPESLLPEHKVRIVAIRRCIDDWPFYCQSQASYIQKKGIEWAELMEKHNLFKDIDEKKPDAWLWLKKHLQENVSIPLNRTCGHSHEEIIAWCYASYFIWRKKQVNNDSVDLFDTRLKKAWATKKNRLKNKAEKKLKPLNVNITQESHDKLRYIATSEGISNNKVIMSAIELLYNKKTER
ncbi:hypothetical protein [Citrobacter sp. VF227]